MKWKMVKLCEVISKKISGEWGVEAKDDNSVFVLRTTNFKNNGELCYENVVKRQIDRKKIENKKMLSGDILIEKSGGSPNQPVGRVVYFAGDRKNIFLCNNFTSILRPNEKVHPKFLFRYLYSIYKKGKVLKYQNKTTGIINLKLDQYLKEEIPLPSLSDQERIAAILDKADSIRKKRREALEKCDEFLKHAFLDMFGDPATNPKGWKVVDLKKLSIKIQIGPFGSQLHKKDYINDGIPLINPKNIIDMKIIPQKSFTISKEKFNEFPKYHLKEGDIIMARRGEMGRCALITNKESNWFCGTGSLYVRPKRQLVNSTYLLRILTDDYIKNILNHESLGITMCNLNKGIVSKLPILLPPIEFQKQFAKIVERTEAMKSRMRSSLEELDNNFNKLMQMAFKGEL